jgi:hypothetical protein
MTLMGAVHYRALFFPLVMKAKRPLPVPQRDFAFAQDTFNLFCEPAIDGERIARERAESEKAKALAEKAQARLFRSTSKRTRKP